MRKSISSFVSFISAMRLNASSYSYSRFIYIGLLSALSLLFASKVHHDLIDSAFAADESDLDYGAETIEGESLPGLIPPQRAIKPFSNDNESENNQEEEKPKPKAKKKNNNGDAPAELNLNAKDIEISTLVKTVSKITGRNYIVDSGVKGKITIHLPTPVSMDEALRIFDSVLLLKGFTTVPVGNNIWKVIKTKNAQTTTIPIVYESPETPSDVLVTQLVRLKHVPADDMRGVMQQFISRDGGINTFDGTNSIIIIDSAANIHRLLELVERLDVPATDQDITIIPIEHAEANDIAQKINDILGENEASSSSNRRTSTRNRRTSRTRSRNRTSRSRSRNSSSSNRRRLPLKILPDERTNSLIVVADPELTVKVQALVEQLDSPLDKSSGRFFVYKLQHADAEELGEILNNLISGATSSSSTSGRRTSGSSLSRSNRNRNTNNNSRNNRNTGNNNRSNPNAGRVNFEGDVSIAPDPSTNSIIINAAKPDYLRLKDVIKVLDIKRRQVLVEATLLEVQLTEDEGFGVKFQGSGGNENGGLVSQSNSGALSQVLTSPTSFLSSPTALSDLTIAAASSGSLTLPGGIVIPSQAAMISAFSRNSNVNVLSSPNILATDNEEAEIIVGENVPFITGSGTNATDLNNTFNSIERQDVGITLRITPQISQGDYVSLSIFVEISNVVPDSRESSLGPTTTVRTTETTVEVKDGQMIVTGGLISDNITNSNNGVPILKEIPVLGNLFKTDTKNQTKNNLLVFITPRIIRDQFDARESTIAYRNKLEDEYIENDGAPDHVAKMHSEGVNNVTETLPDSDLSINPGRVIPPNLSGREKTAFENTQNRLEALARSSKKKKGTKKRSAKKSSKPGISAKIKNAKAAKKISSPDTLAKVTKTEVIKPPSPKVSEQNKSRASFGSDSNISEVDLTKRKSTTAIPLSSFPKLKKGDEFSENNYRDKKLKIKAAPPLPTPDISSLSASKTKSSLKKTNIKSNKKIEKTPLPSASLNSAEQKQSFIVLKSLNPQLSQQNPNIKLADKLGTVGIAIPGSSKSFFNPGQRYKNGPSSENYVVLGRYSSASEAASLHKSLKNPSTWDVLNNNEVEGLGKRSWLKDK